MEKNYYEKTYSKGTTYLVVPRAIWFVKPGEHHLVIDPKGEYDYCKVIEVNDSNQGSKIVRYRRYEDNLQFVFHYSGNSLVYFVSKILKVNLASKELWKGAIKNVRSNRKKENVSDHELRL